MFKLPQAFGLHKTLNMTIKSRLISTGGTTIGTKLCRNIGIRRAISSGNPEHFKKLDINSVLPNNIYPIHLVTGSIHMSTFI